MTPDYVSPEDFGIPCLLVDEKVYLMYRGKEFRRRMNAVQKNGHLGLDCVHCTCAFVPEDGLEATDFIAFGVCPKCWVKGKIHHISESCLIARLENHPGGLLPADFFAQTNDVPITIN